MEDVAEKITSLSMEDYIKGYYIKEEQDEWMKKVDINDAMKKGLKKSEKLGLEKGINQNKIETAKILLKKGVSLDIICEATGLTKEEIEKL